MFNTIKSKILLIVFSMLITLTIVLSAFTYVYLKNTKTLVIKTCSIAIGEFVQSINKDILKIEDNTRDLALAGEMYIDYKKKSGLELITKKVFENYPESLGGGIWFLPYHIDKSKRLNCVYAYRSKNNEILIDDSFEKEDYNYPGQKWYKEIINKLSKEKNIAWSMPYFEKEGSNTYMVTAGAGIYKNDELIGISTVDWDINDIVKEVYNIRPTEHSFALFADEKNDFIIASTDPYIHNPGFSGKSLKTLSWYNDSLRKITYFTYKNKKFVPYVKTLDNGMILIVNVPKDELFYFIVMQVSALFVLLMIISIIISILLYMGLQNNITRPINILMDIAREIGKGKLNTEIKLEKPEEFAHLASTFNKMTHDIEKITKQREKMESELLIAKEIQSSALPDKFPAYPERYDFDIYACMDAARDVGGDFYDFYFIDEDKLLFLIADVSGKGVPAALFMMTVKTLVNTISKEGLSPKELIKEINNTICSNNKRGLFVTMFIGIMDFKQSKLTCINCGHNPPLIKQIGNYDYLHLESNVVLGAIKDMDFEIKEIPISPNDSIFIYTDGITEAMDKNSQLYGELRLKNILNSSKNLSSYDICKNIKDDVALYSGGIEQSDDITMLVFKYFGNVDSYKNIASKENYKYFKMWLEDKIKDISSDIKYKIELCFEEIYTNIFSYAYPEGYGEVEVKINKGEDIELEFIDRGIKYNPLDKPDPDIEQSLDERQIGGLGIYMVKKNAKSVEYKYENANILTLKF